MAKPPKFNLKHILLVDSARSEKYSPPTNAFGTKNYPIRQNRKRHANRLLEEINDAIAEAKIEMRQNPQKGGSYFEIIGVPGYDLKTESLNNKNVGMNLLNVRELPTKEKAATVFLPNKKIDFLNKTVTEYKTEDSTRGKIPKPKHNDLVSSIEHVRPAQFNAFYTDDVALLPKKSSDEVWWEVWIKNEAENVSSFMSFLEGYEVPHDDSVVEFYDLTVTLVFGSIDMLNQHLTEVGYIAEIKRAKDVTIDLYEMKNSDQKDWSLDLAKRSELPAEDSPFVCILDTGVNRDHVLIAPVLAANDLHSVILGQDGYDRVSHGTAMAGLVAWGDLESALMSKAPVALPVRLESVNVRTNVQNDLKLYGNLTQEAAARAAATRPNVNRVICMALSYPHYNHRGTPSSWSAAIDDLSFGKIIDDKILVVLAAGNIDVDPSDYPAEALTTSIHDPGQSWNALTVGYFASKDKIADKVFANWNPLAPLGGLGPSSCTSLTWQKNKWPLKPDVVFEGGNFGVDPTSGKTDTPLSLQLLTLHNRYPHQKFNLTMETSAATALVSRFCGMVFKAYPNAWPEMVRALIVHSAEWTEEMRKLVNLNTKNQRESLLRTVGYGIPDFQRAINSASNNLNLLIQDEIAPFDTSGKMNELRLHKLPWPKEALEELGDLPVKMKITLSYFIEPDPNSRGWDYKYRYSSFGLRFDVKQANETLREFRTRINKASRDDDADEVSSESDSDEWYFGKQIRSKGSIHTDYWEGTAADLASREYMAVYPTSGWWKIKNVKENADRQGRYALIVSVSTPSEDVDVYSLIENEINIEIEI